MDTIDEFIDKAKVAWKNGEFNHGTATLKIDMQFSNGTIVPTGTTGQITAFLPDMDAYSVLFNEDIFPGCWATFNNLDWFGHFFDYELKPDKE